MWLSVVTYDLVALRALAVEDAFEILLTIMNKKNDIIGSENDGTSIPGFQAPESIIDIDPNLTSLTVKRLWSTQARAQEFSNFAGAAAEFITASVEQET